MRKPRINVPTNFDALDARASQVITSVNAALAAAAVEGVNTTALGDLGLSLLSSLSVAKAKHDAGLAGHQAAEVLTGERDVAVRDVVMYMRKIRDMGFAEFSEDYNRLSEWGFEVIQTPVPPPAPPEE